MTTVKADAHFVDSDIIDGPGGDWTSDQYGIPAWIDSITNEGAARFFDSSFDLITPPGSTLSTGTITHGCDIGGKGLCAFGCKADSAVDDALILTDYNGVLITDRTFAMGDFCDGITDTGWRTAFSYDSNSVYCIYNTIFGANGLLIKYRVSDDAAM